MPGRITRWPTFALLERFKRKRPQSRCVCGQSCDNQSRRPTMSLDAAHRRGGANASNLSTVSDPFRNRSQPALMPSYRIHQPIRWRSKFGVGLRCVGRRWQHETRRLRPPNWPPARPSFLLPLLGEVIGKPGRRLSHGLNINFRQALFLRDYARRTNPAEKKVTLVAIPREVSSHGGSRNDAVRPRLAHSTRDSGRRRTSGTTTRPPRRAGARSRN